MTGVGAGYSSLPGRGGREDLREERHALHGPHGDVERPGDVHGHGRCEGHGVGEAHGRRGGDVDRGDVHRAGDGDRVLQAHSRGDVAQAHLRGDGDGVGGGAGAAVGAAAAAHAGARGGDVRDGGRVAHIVAIWKRENKKKKRKKKEEKKDRSMVCLGLVRVNV